MLITPSQDEKLEELTLSKDQLNTDIKRKMPRTVKRDIKKGKTKLLSLKDEVQKGNDALYYLYAKLDNLEVSEFDDHTWTKTLNNILDKSLSLNIKLDYIKNSDSNQSKSNSGVIPKKYIDIQGRGKYSDALEYLNFIENRDYIVNVKDIKMKSLPDSSDIEFNINFTIYGVTL
jgi:hypothetical protein